MPSVMPSVVGPSSARLPASIAMFLNESTIRHLTEAPRLRNSAFAVMCGTADQVLLAVVLLLQTSKVASAAGKVPCTCCMLQVPTSQPVCFDRLEVCRRGVVVIGPATSFKRSCCLTCMKTCGTEPVSRCPDAVQPAFVRCLLCKVHSYRFPQPCMQAHLL